MYLFLSCDFQFLIETLIPKNSRVLVKPTNQSTNPKTPMWGTDKCQHRPWGWGGSRGWWTPCKTIEHMLCPKGADYLQLRLIFALWEYRLCAREKMKFKRIWKADFVFNMEFLIYECWLHFFFYKTSDAPKKRSLRANLGTFLMSNWDNFHITLSRKKNRRLRFEVRNLGATMRHWTAMFMTLPVDPGYSSMTPKQLFLCQIFWLGIPATILREFGMELSNKRPPMLSTYAHTSTSPPPFCPPFSVFQAVFCCYRN